MTLLLPNISTILASHLHGITENGQFWETVDSVTSKMLKKRASEFRDLVKLWYENRDILNPERLDHAIYYVKNMMEDGFDLNLLFGSLQNPLLVVETLWELKTTPPVKSFFEKRGNVDKVVSLLLKCGIGDGKDMKRYYVLVVNLMIDLMMTSTVDSFMRHFGNQMYGLIMSLSMPNDANILRCLILLTERLLPGSDRDGAQKKLIDIMKMYEESYHCDIVNRYVRQKAGKYITYEAFTRELMNQRVHTTGFFELITEMALSDENWNKLLIVRFLGRFMIRSKVWAKLVQACLEKILMKSDSEVCEWFKQYLLYCFIFLRLCIRRKKYLRRAIRFASVLATFETQWIRDEVDNIASCAFAKSTHYISNFFSVGESNKECKFDTELAKYGKGAKYNFKHFPFRKDQVVLVGEDIIMSYKKVSDDIFDPAGYMTEMELGDRRAQEKTIDSVRHFLEELRNTREKYSQIYKESSSSPPELSNVIRKYIPVARFLTSLHQQVEKNLYEFKVQKVEQFWNLTEDIISRLSENPHLSIDVVNLRKAWKRRIEGDAYTKLVDDRKRVRTHLLEVKYPMNQSVDLDRCNPEVDSESGYVYPGATDEQVYSAIHQSKFSATALHPIAVMIGNGNVSEVTVTIRELCKTVAGNLNFHSFVHFSVVRIVFDEALLLRDQLQRFAEEDRLFCQRTTDFGRQSMKQIGIRADVLADGGDQSLVSEYFKRMRVVHSMEFLWCNNPIDIAWVAYQSINAIPLFINKSLSEFTTEHKQILLLAIFSADPPINAVSAAVFAQRWIKLVPTEELREAVQLLYNTVHMLIDLHKC